MTTVLNARKLRPIKSGSIRSQVISVIREAIFSGKFRPGDDLRELHLARDLQISQATVREALLHLEHTGLVVRIPNKGTSVTKLSDEELRERISVRLPLEAIAAVNAARRMKKEDFAELDRRLKKIAKTVAKDSTFEYIQADLDFHRFIWRCSDNKTLSRILEHLTAPLFAFLAIQRESDPRRIKGEKLKDIVTKHEPIVEALRGGDALRIMDAIRTHLMVSFPKFLDPKLEPEDIKLETLVLKSRHVPPKKTPEFK
jgi:DNA-binding GntR family transcriptional regulator